MLARRYVSDDGTYVGSKGREIVALTVLTPEPKRRILADQPSGAFKSMIWSKPLWWYRETFGGDVFTVVSPGTGRQHQVSLTPFADLDPERTIIEISFFFFPAPFRSREAQLIHERTIKRIREYLEYAVDIHTDQWRQKAEERTGIPIEQQPPINDIDGAKKRMIDQALRYGMMASDVGIILMEDFNAIYDEFMRHYPDIFPSLERKMPAMGPDS